MIEIKGLNKVYENTHVLQGIDLSIEKNKIYGLLGRNGAGKTTLMKIITAQEFPTNGKLSVFGEQPYENQAVLDQICFVKESQKYPDNFSVKHALDVAATLFKNWDQVFADELIAEFALPMKRKIKKLSRGMQSAVGIIIGLASRAPLTIFDEPYLGLDAVARSTFYEKLLEDYAEHPRTVILSTHLIDEVSNLLEHIVLINKGKILLDEDAENVRHSAYTITGPKAKVLEFSNGEEIIHQESLGGVMTCTILGDAELAAKTSGLQVSAVSLQQLFVQLTKLDEKGARIG